MTRLAVAALLCVCLFPSMSSAQGVAGPLLAASGRVATAMSVDPSLSSKPTVLTSSSASTSSSSSGGSSVSTATKISVGVAGAFVGFLAGAKIGGGGGSEQGVIAGGMIGAGVGAVGLVLFVSRP